MALSETEYVLCRQIGGAKAREKIESLVESRSIEIIEDSALLHDATKIKCSRAIALGDCYTLALAERLNGTALFARQEKDLEKETKRKPFPVKIAFLQPVHPSER